MEILLIIILLALSGLFSGLTLGLMKLDTFELKRKMKLGDKEAKAVYAIRRHGNELLTALLLGNVAVNSFLAIFLGSLTSGLLATITATALILLFGEIIPQAVIARYALAFGAKTVPLVKFLLLIFKPISKPIGWSLDKVLGEELQTIYSKEELLKIVAEHEDSSTSAIDRDEEKIVHGALSFSDKTAGDIMTPRTVVFMLEESTKIDKSTIETIKDHNFSRIPIFKETQDKIIGILYIKDLLGVRSGKIKKYTKLDYLKINEKTKLDKLKNRMIKARQHMAIVLDEFKGFAGVVTLEDILEEVIGSEILDESDEHADLREVAKKIIEE